MQPPPKPKGPATGPQDLAEVERALSVLQGRHPEHERVRREQEEASRKRHAERDQSAAAEHAKVQRRRIRLIAIGGFSFVLLLVFGLSFRREVVRRGRIEQAGDPYRAMGFAVVDTSSRGSKVQVDATLDPACIVVASTDSAPIKVTRPGGAFEGPGPVLFCTCQNEHLTATSEVTDNGGIVMLRADAPAIGGSRAFALVPFKPGTTARSDEACNDASLDAWLDAKHAPDPRPDAAWLAAKPERAVLLASHATALGTIAPPAPFVSVTIPKESCLVATSTSASDRLSLRTRGGAQPFAPAAGAIAWCGASETGALVQREGDGTVEVIAIPAANVGGMLGVREIAKKAGIALAFTGVAATDHAWNAKALLLSSSVPENIIKTASTPEIAPDPDARLVAISFGTPNALTSESKEEVFSYCEPSIGDATREALCIFSGEQRWKPTGAEAVGAVARSKLPFWLFGLAGVSDPVALKAGISLAALARRLKHDGFEPTTIEALTELPNGVDVLGRTGEDAIVAVGVMGAPPYVVPYAEGGAAWSIDGEPPLVILKPLEKRTLTTSLKLAAPKERRRSVVFRRQKRD
jgi:hypothetical protein